MLSRKWEAKSEFGSQEWAWLVWKNQREQGKSGGLFLDSGPLFWGLPLTLMHNLTLIAAIFYTHYAYFRDIQTDTQGQWATWDDIASQEQRKYGPHAPPTTRSVWEGQSMQDHPYFWYQLQVQRFPQTNSRFNNLLGGIHRTHWKLLHSWLWFITGKGCWWETAKEISM